MIYNEKIIHQKIKKMQNFVTDFAQKPYLVPDPGNSQPFVPMYPYGESNSSILINVGSDRNSTTTEFGDLDTNFQNLDRNLPQIVKLQESKLEPGPKLELHDGSLPLFMSYFADTTVHPYSMCPFPKIDLDDVQNILTNIVDGRTPPDRGSWILHYIVRQFDYRFDLTALLRDFKWNDDEYYAKLCFYTYRRNILNCYEFISGMIERMRPVCLTIFKEEIFRSHMLCAQALSNNIDFPAGETVQKAKQSYYTMMREDFCQKRTHLIQFSVLNGIKSFSHIPMLYDYSVGADLTNLMLKSPNMIRRSRFLYQAASSSLLPASYQLQNLITSNYPNFDLNKLKNGTLRIIAFLQNKKETNQIIFDLLEIPFWFPENSSHLAAAIVYVIQLLPKSEFDVENLAKFAFQHVDEISCFKHVFAELQAAKFFNYADFINIILFSSHFQTLKSEAISIVSTLPFYGPTKENIRIFLKEMKHLGQNPFDETIRVFVNGSQNTEQIIFANKSKFESLPYTVQYCIGSFICGNTKSFTEAAEIIMTYNLNTLFPVLIEKIQTTPDAKFNITHKILSSVVDSIPILILHGKFNTFIELLLNNTANPTIVELFISIHEKFKDSIVVQDKSKETYSQIVKNFKSININSDNIHNFFRIFSYLCSLHVFDAFHSIDCLHDFEVIMPTFISNLLNFKSLKSSTLIHFFEEFTESGCISQPSNFFIKTLLSVILGFKESDFTDRIMELLSDFFSYAFKFGHYLPVNYFSECRRKRFPAEIISKVTSILILAAKRNPDVFNPYNTLNDNIVKNFANDTNLLMTYISIICQNCRLPQLTAELVHQCDSSTAQTVTLPCCFFAMLPEGARCSTFEESIENIKELITRENAKLIGYWLKVFLFYSNNSQGQTFPVTFSAPDKSNISKYFTNVAEAFFTIFNTPMDQAKADTFLLSWSTCLHVDRNKRSELYSNIYSSPMIANAAVQSFQLHLSAGDINFNGEIAYFIHPAIQIASVQSIDQLVDTFIAFNYSSINFEKFTTISAIIYVVYITRCQNNPNLMRIESIVYKLLEWIQKVSTLSETGKLDFLIDAFNFVMCYSANIKELRDIKQQESIHMKIKDVYLQLTPDVQKKIILNLPPQYFQLPVDPLYSTVTKPEPEPMQLDLGQNMMMGGQTSFMPPPPPPPPTMPDNSYEIGSMYEEDFLFQW